MIRHAVLQLRPEKGHIKQNLAHLKEALLALKPERPEVVVLPEAYPTGYFLQGGVRELALTQEELHEALAELHAEVWKDPLDLVIGFYERDGGEYYNSAAYLELGGRGILHVHRKVFLPTYGVFDEERFLARGHDVRAFDTRFGRAAVLICEDFWHSITATIAALDGAEVIYVPSASPARGFTGKEPANVARWKALAAAVAAEHGLYVVLASLVGAEGGKMLSGGSVVAGPEGGLLAEAPLFEEALLLTEIDLERIPPVRYDNPLLADLKSGLPLVFPELKRIVEAL
ncbi:nitrilase-related carbon-nitrogen hydrolase [Marinithermus hydrothermalis]|uniref:Nitrilase/cyanide hydratase and apolipoprotein N-acyltransferase n=1 Tax=Marinithermus hydrothermalis (strain DSM 14884 / JCM 11576 / T1) TaxID=869210 RepID=F2NND4_MARHT|nr:nitrilase-related carbon-nitrogen hydrolase [Marinithermus hydrothermalis]AEB10975.1 Nitrilase/cyanide hydratase and apolipoprotein N-acyltransferase [Marinithermus hydrothermalis DSM 14884]